ncbi:hypothetical protein ACFROC_01810 [Nocardia tengchongensis]|uniref:hypothetical protein n=1 Tax=Nocardia tengchongensis TaxID=2055889 RepID=UPI00369C630C
MTIHRTKMAFAASLIACALAALGAAPSALATAGCPGDNHGGNTHSNEQRGGRYTLGEGGHYRYLPNGVGALGCIPGSTTRPCEHGGL